MIDWVEEKRILLVSGKGGVGKSTVAAAIASQQARKGRRVLLVELSPYSYFSHYFDRKDIGYQPVQIEENLSIAQWSATDCLREYVTFLLKSERLFQLFFENKIMKTFLAVAPGLQEIAILGKLTSGLRKVGPPLPYDLIVADIYATGHALSLLRAPKGLHQAISLGPMGEQSRQIDQILRDQKTLGMMLVTTPEEVPVIETVEFYKQIESEFQLSSRVVCNQWVPFPLTPQDWENCKNDLQDNPEVTNILSRWASLQQRQESAFKTLSALHSGVEKLNTELETSPQQLIQALSKQIEGHWQ